MDLDREGNKKHKKASHLIQVNREKRFSALVDEATQRAYQRNSKMYRKLLLIAVNEYQPTQQKGKMSLPLLGFPV